MNLEKTERLLSLLKQYGVSHYKAQEIEIRLGPSDTKMPELTEHVPQAIVSDLPGSAIPPVQIEIPHHVNEVANLLKLSDNELVDRLFPDPTQPSEAKE